MYYISDLFSVFAKYLNTLYLLFSFGLIRIGHGVKMHLTMSSTIQIDKRTL